ncbi:MAG: hypothetical protein FWC47_00225, partial [Oscillospiraceae bacterium]|nr:hypothetical protein [Oscillospiraceae bacterium]
NPIMMTFNVNDGKYTVKYRGDELDNADFNKIFKDEIDNLNKNYDYCILETCANEYEFGWYEIDLLNIMCAKELNVLKLEVSEFPFGKRGTHFIFSISDNCSSLDFDFGFDFHESFLDASKFVSKNPNLPIDVAVLATPYMSSLIDIAPLSIENDVSIRVIRDKREFSDPDLLIIPGSTNTCKDMVYVRKFGLDNIVREYSKHGLIVGICGGYQLLGKKLIDPDHVESDVGEQEAIGLLNVDTIFEKNAVFNRASGKTIPLGFEIDGCENHFGVSYNKEKYKDFVHISIENEKEISKDEGAYNDSFNVFGTYLHRCFETPYFREYILNRIREKKSLKKNTSKHYDEYLKEQIEKLSNEFDKNIERTILWEKL